MDTFIAIDVETANASRHSICQIGLAAFHAGVPLWRWQTLVNPEEPFEARNVEIHGITSQHASIAPTFSEALEGIRPTIDGQLLACHTPFDYDAFLTAAEKYDVSLPSCRWIDTCEIARLSWPALETHALDRLCAHLDIPLVHHDAGSDALACGHILHRATKTLGVELPSLIERVGTIEHCVEYRPTTQLAQRYSERIELSGRKDGPLAGHVLVCTGDMAHGERRIAELAAALGCNVEDRFTQSRTTILVTGARDPSLFNGNLESRKIIEAKKAKAKGKNIAILTENEFLALAQRYGLAAA